MSGRGPLASGRVEGRAVETDRRRGKLLDVKDVEGFTRIKEKPEEGRPFHSAHCFEL